MEFFRNNNVILPSFLAFFFIIAAVHPVSAEPSPGFADIIEPCLDAVVNISATFPQPVLPPLDLQFPEDLWGHRLQEMLPKAKGSSLNVTALGSGFFIHPEGYIVTNLHVIQNVLNNNGKVTVILNSGKEIAVSIVGIDSRSDLALLKAKSDKPFPYLTWGDSSRARIGDWVLAVGNPFGLGGTVTSGIVSNAQRSMLPDKIGEATHVDLWLQTDAPINEGSSGGPLIDMRGKVIGINTAIFSPTRGGNVGISFAIPEKIARSIIEQLRKDGVVKRGWIGIKLGPFVTLEMASTMGLPPVCGVLVDGVVPNQGADKAGIEVGDVITKVRDIVVTSVSHLRTLVSSVTPGDILDITLIKQQLTTEDKKKVVKVSVGNLESDQHSSYPKTSLSSPQTSKKILGMVLEQANKVPKHLQKQWHWEPFVARGVIIVKADKKNSQKLRAGDVILKVGMRSVSTPEDIFRILHEIKKSVPLAGSAKTILLLVWRPEEGQFHHVFQINDDGNDS